MKLRELPNWAPSTTASNVLKSVEPRRRENWVVFTGHFEGDPHTYDYEAKHARLAEHIANQFSISTSERA